MGVTIHEIRARGQDTNQVKGIDELAKRLSGSPDFEGSAVLLGQVGLVDQACGD